MSKKLDLQTYLSRYQSEEFKRRTADSSSNKFYPPTKQTAEPRPFPNNNTIYQEVNYYNEISPIAFTETTDFTKSQNECLALLQTIRRRLVDEENQMNGFMESFNRQLHENLLREHQRIRDEFLEMFERSFQENERRLRESLRQHGSVEPMEFTNIRKRISQINQKIDRLEQGLRSESYRPVIAEIVVSDFDGETKDVERTIVSTQKALLDSAFKIHADPVRFNRIKDDVEHLVVFEDTGKKIINNNPVIPATQRQPEQGNYGAPLVNSVMRQSGTGERTRSRPKLGLFESLPSAHQNRDAIQGTNNFFNFNS